MMQMNDLNYLSALDKISRDAASAILYLSRLQSLSARRYLNDLLLAEPGAQQSLLADPVFELAPDWKGCGSRYSDLLGGLLRADLVDALHSAKEPLDRVPFLHQHRAWRAALEEQKSFIVTSGTGSGKTECFLAPVINDLLAAREAEGGRLTGVRAIALYPLNALIASQRKRLGAWMAPYGGDLRYALYNSHLEKRLASRERRRLPAHEVPDREVLRDAPPPFLVTNITMLEYMLARSADAPIIEQSQGRLRWIVLDEAHSYVGAQAAELAFLLRRVRDAFGVKPENCRILATSATVGRGAEVTDMLRRFIAEIGGVAESSVAVIEGEPRSPDLPKIGAASRLDGEALATESDPQALWNQLAPHPAIRRMRDRISDGDGRLSDLASELGLKTGAAAKREAFALLDAAGRAQDRNGQRLLPWRMHAFQRALPGIWSCADRDCRLAEAQMGAERDWPFGALYAERREKCECGAPVFEVSLCDECGDSALLANREIGAAVHLHQRTDIEDADDYALEREPDEDDGDDEAQADASVQRHCLLRPAGEIGARLVDRETRQIWDDPAAAQDRPTFSLTICEPDDRSCCGAPATTRLRPMRYGAPFLLGVAAPTLLRSAQSEGKRDQGAAFDGRRTISFTDSRQGTARFAAKLQQEAERTLSRAVIYHKINADGGGANAEEEKLRSEIEELRPVANNTMVAKIIADKEKELEAIHRPAPVSFGDMVAALAEVGDFQSFVADLWNRAARDRLGEAPEKLAEMFLYRESFRRPRVQNNVETMGLAALTFPELEETARLDPCQVFVARGLDGDAWVSFLRLCVDFVFRQNLAVNAPKNLIHWASPSRFVGVILPPGADPDKRATRHAWPSPSRNRNHRLVRMAAAGLRLALEEPSDRDLLDEVMRAAWRVFRKSGVVRETENPNEFALDYRKAAFVRPERWWLCPITRRFFAYAFCGLSPYGFSRSSARLSTAMSAEPLPRPPQISPVGFDSERRSEVEAWLASDPAVAKLRARGLWSDLHDRTLSFQPFLRSVEHSAQVNSATLQDYEKAFEAGRINVLNCSTTMEMGVDLAGVDVVLNANVPPAPANYRQRVGRAGRRDEHKALAFTFCKDTPIERAVFLDPQGRLLKGAMRPPEVRLDSAVIAQRHVNMFLLSRFIRDATGWSPRGSEVTVPIGPFMGASDDIVERIQEDAPIDRFLDALHHEFQKDQTLADRLQDIVSGSALDGASNLPRRAAEAMMAVRDRWLGEYRALQAAAKGLKNDAFKRLTYRARRMRDEFMFAELARRGFAPAYGFPVDVVSFDALGLAPETGRVSPYASGPSRTMDIAIRDYAPGADIVVDGLVYKSGGVRPSWSTYGASSKVDDLRTRWRCRQCNAFDITAVRPEVCPDCGKDDFDHSEILRPSGFYSRARPHASYEQVDFIRPSEPLVSAIGADWSSLPDAALGRMRTSRSGRVLYQAGGPEGHGYALCLTCGAAAPETGAQSDSPTPQTPASIARHHPLIDTGKERRDGFCQGPDTTSAIRRFVRLGHQIETDVFELQIFGCTEQATAFTLAIAIREALVRRLGIDAEELGVSARGAVDPHGGVVMSILLFDHASGGAGFAPLAADELERLLGEAEGFLDCPARCAAACPSCVLRRDVQFSEDRLDRRAALELLRTQILPRLRIPKDSLAFGPSTKAEMIALPDLLSTRLLRGAQGQRLGVDLFLHEAADGFDLSGWAARALLDRLAGSDAKVRFFIDFAALGGLDLAAKLALTAMLSTVRGTLHAIDLPQTATGHRILAIRRQRGEAIAYAAADTAAAAIGPDWGRASGGPILRGPAPMIDPSEALDPEETLLCDLGDAVRLELARDLDGPASAFGSAFWEAILKKRSSIATRGRLQQITYEDRYVCSPLALRLLFETIRMAPGFHAASAIDLRFARINDNRRGPNDMIWSNWSRTDQRDAVMRALLPRANLSTGTPRNCAHARTLDLKFEDGSIETITLDQGFGYWEAAESKPFDFTQGAKNQARELSMADFAVCARNRGAWPTPIVISWKRP